MRLRAGVAVVLAVAGLRAQLRLEVSWRLPAAGLAYGEAFEVEVERAWPPDAEPEAFDQAALAPVSLRLLAESTATATAGGAAMIRQRLRYAARAHAVGEVVLPPVVFRARRGGAIETASCTPPVLAVRSCLPEPPGDIEWPCDVRELPRRTHRTAWLVAAGACLCAGAFWWQWVAVRRRAPAPERAAPVEPALARLSRLCPPVAGAACEPFYVELAAIVRDHCEHRLAVPAVTRTSQELVAAVPAGGAALADCLLACDLVKFAAARPAAERHAAALACARAFVGATAGGADPR